jgi:nicotinamidase-related amidase
MNPSTTAVILVGFQNDNFAANGVLRSAYDDSAKVDTVLSRTVSFLQEIVHTGVTIICTPIVLDADYRALASPIGILSTIKESGAFRLGTPGAETVPEFAEFGDRIAYVHGKVGFNAFSNTALEQALHDHGVKDVVVAGVISSLCIDSTGRAAYERGFDVTMLSDCTGGRTETEHRFYCEQVFPLYGTVRSSREVVDALRGVTA